MKKIIILCLVIACNLSCKAQSTAPIEKKIEFIRAESGIPETVTYLKDVNGVRDKYVGTWKGIYNGKNYELIFSNTITTYDGLTQDRLIMRYLITDTNGWILEDTRSEPNGSAYVVESYYYDKSFFVLTYIGRQNKCGQGGELFVMLTKNSNTKIELFLIPKQGFINSNDCPNGAAVQLFPKEKMILIKQ